MTRQFAGEKLAVRTWLLAVFCAFVTFCYYRKRKGTPIMASEEPFTRRLDAPRQDLNDAYSLPANFLEIEVTNPETHGIGRGKKYTDYEVKLKTNLPVFRKVCV